MSGERDIRRLTRARLRQLQQLRTTRGRHQQRAFLIDGEKLVRDALNAGAPITELLSREPDHWSNAGHPLTAISRADAERLSDARTPQGHFAVVEDRLGAPHVSGDDAWRVVALDAVQDAGNVGGIIRSAAAFGVDAVLIGPGSADPTHPRVTRAATGAWFRVAIHRSADLRADLDSLRSDGGVVLAAHTCGALLGEVELPDKIIWLFGNEGSGISDELAPVIDQRVAISTSENVDSLNVSVAAGIILHHAARRWGERNGS